MSTKTYWRANKATSKKIDAIMERLAGKVAVGLEIAKEFGATDVYRSQAFTTIYVSGFRFKNPPDPKVFCRLANTDDGWRPRRNGAGKALSERLEALRDNALSDVSKVVGYDPWKHNISTPGINMVNGVAYLIVAGDNVTLKGCTRISDIAHEKATSKPKRKRKAAAK